ncbi:A24 family peptidase [Raoultella planticola]|nr:A24 family peptidase [Raoultella planticola]MCE9858293.1 A24 family peptidase [Raoultella planticola]
MVTGKEALGYGDFKLLAALGAWLGWQALPQIILLAAGSSLVVNLLQHLLMRRNINQPLVYGPWLALSGVCNILVI